MFYHHLLYLTTKQLSSLQELDALPAPPTWYFPLTDDPWTIPRKYRQYRDVPFDAEATAIALRLTTLRLLKQAYMQELLTVGSEPALQRQKEAQLLAQREKQERLNKTILANSIPIGKITLEPTAEEGATEAALPEPPEWFFSAGFPLSDVRCLWQPGMGQSWEEMDARLTELESKSRKRAFQAELQEAGGLEKLREQKVAVLQQCLESTLWRFCQQEP